MREFKFKTNIKCAGCLAKVTPVLDAKEGIAEWEVDLQDGERILTLKTDGLTEEEVRVTVAEAGFNAEVK